MKAVTVRQWSVVLLMLLAGISLWWQGQQQPKAPAPLFEIQCQPERGNCVANINGGQVLWRVDKPIQYLQVFSSDIHLQNFADIDVQRVSVEFVMHGMQMAVNQSLFTKNPTGIWQTQSILPLCVSGRKDWLAIVRVETVQGVLQTGFQFTLTK